MPAPVPTDVVVLGGGVAGLAAARRVAATGRTVVLLEREETLGGTSASFELAGVRVDHGSQRLHHDIAPDLLDEVRGLLGDDLQERRRSGRLRLHDTWFDLPVSTRDIARAAPRAVRVRMAREAAAARFRRRRRSSHGAALTSAVGDALYDALHGPVARKRWGVDGTAIDVDQAHRLIGAGPAPSRWGVTGRADDDAETYFYPRRGFGQLAEALGAAAVAEGATVLTGAEVVAIEAREGIRPVVMTSDGTTYVAGRVFSTLPLTALPALIRPTPSPRLISDAAKRRYRALVLVYLVHHGGRWTDHDAHYLPSLDTPVSRLSEPANYRDSDDDPADRSVVCAEIPCDVGDECWTATDGELAGVVVDTVVRHGLPALSVDGAVVRRIPRAYPVPLRGYALGFNRLEVWAATVPRVTSFSRLGLVAHDTHEALAMARDAAAALTDKGWDDAKWAASRGRP